MAEGATHISLPTQEYDRGRQEKTNRRTNTNKLGVNQGQRKVCNTTCMCIPDSRYGLTLAWVTSENSTMLLESDSSWLTLAGPYPMLPCFSARCLMLTAPPRSSTPTSAVRLSPVQPQLPFLLSSHQLPVSCPTPNCLSWVASSTLIRVLLPLPDTARFHVQESFVWFRAKTDSSALAAYPHSATRVLIYERCCIFDEIPTNLSNNFMSTCGNTGYDKLIFTKIRLLAVKLIVTSFAPHW